VDAPEDAVRAGDALVTRLLGEIGYPTDNYDDQLATLSVEHATTLGHYRDAHDIFLRADQGEASTEQLRQALVHYRALFAELIGDEPVPPVAGEPGRPATDDDRAAEDRAAEDRAAEDRAAEEPTAAE